MTAPRLLLETTRAYFARTPDVYRGAGGIHARLPPVQLGVGDIELEAAGRPHRS